MRRASLLVLLVVLAACDDAAKPMGPPIVVYAGYVEGPYFEEFFADFTEQTGTAVTVVYGESANLAKTIIDNKGSPAADVFLTREVQHLWWASDVGALRPIQAHGLEQVPVFLKDPDKHWAAIDFQIAVIATREPDEKAWPAGYAELAEARFRGQVCVSSSTLAVNRTVISMFINELGVKTTERMVRGWMRNLAKPPFETDLQLLAAVKAGDCKFGLLSGWLNGAAHTSVEDIDLQMIFSTPSFVEIEAVGIARHASNPLGAEALIEWLLSESVNRKHSTMRMAHTIYQAPGYVVSQKNVGIAGWRDEEARLLVERAAYR